MLLRQVETTLMKAEWKTLQVFFLNEPINHYTQQLNAVSVVQYESKNKQQWSRKDHK